MYYSPAPSSLSLVGGLGFGLSGFFFDEPLAARLRAVFCSFFVASVVNQFNDGQLGAVAGTPAHLDDARVTAGTILKTLAQFVEQARRAATPAERGGGVCPRRVVVARAVVAGVKERRSLPAQMNARRFRAIAFERSCAPGKRNRPFDVRTQLFRFGQES